MTKARAGDTGAQENFLILCLPCTMTNTIGRKHGSLLWKICLDRVRTGPMTRLTRSGRRLASPRLGAEDLTGKHGVQ
jgi:hypothetical protein